MIDMFEAGTIIIGVRPRPFFDWACGTAAGISTFFGWDLKTVWVIFYASEVISAEDSTLDLLFTSNERIEALWSICTQSINLETTSLWFIEIFLFVTRIIISRHFLWWSIICCWFYYFSTFFFLDHVQPIQHIFEILTSSWKITWVRSKWISKWGIESALWLVATHIEG